MLRLQGFQSAKLWLGKSKKIMPTADYDKIIRGRFFHLPPTGLLHGERGKSRERTGTLWRCYDVTLAHHPSVLSGCIVLATTLV